MMPRHWRSGWYEKGELVTFGAQSILTREKLGGLLQYYFRDAAGVELPCAITLEGGQLSALTYSAVPCLAGHCIGFVKLTKIGH